MRFNTGLHLSRLSSVEKYRLHSSNIRGLEPMTSTDLLFLFYSTIVCFSVVFFYVICKFLPEDIVEVKTNFWNGKKSPQSQSVGNFPDQAEWG